LERLTATRDLGAGAPGEPSGTLVLGRYRLVTRIGSGGHGTVWEAFDQKLERDVAVKVIAREGAPARPRAEREARVAARLNHPGIVALYELGHDDEATYLVSELIRGQTLAELEREGDLSDRDVAQIGIALCEALAHAHGKGIVHRDMKPQNVVVPATPASGAGSAKLTDFGVAHVATDDPLTRTGDVIGTLAYMAPEQAEGRRVTAAADVYALALVLHEAWSGSRPALGVGRHGVRVPSLGRLRRDLPRELTDAIDAALDPRPEHRPPLEGLADLLRTTAAGLSDAGGLVEPGTLERLGGVAPTGAGWPATDRAEGRMSALVRFGRRLASGALAGALVFGAPTTLGPAPPIAPHALAGVVAVAVALLTRVAWLAAAIALCAWLAWPETGRAGTALVLAVTLAATPILLPRAGPLWSLPALGPLLGLVGLAPAFVAIAGVASTGWRRVGLGIAGFLAIAAAELIGGEPLLFGAAEGVTAPATWRGSGVGAARDAVYPTLASPALAPALAFAALALPLPLLVRRRAFAIDVAGAALWALALAAALGALAQALAGSVELTVARGALAGPVLGAVLAVAIVRLGPSRERREGGMVP